MRKRFMMMPSWWVDNWTYLEFDKAAGELRPGSGERKSQCNGKLGEVEPLPRVAEGGRGPSSLPESRGLAEHGSQGPTALTALDPITRSGAGPGVSSLDSSYPLRRAVSPLILFLFHLHPALPD